MSEEEKFLRWLKWYTEKVDDIIYINTIKEKLKELEEKKKEMER